MRVLMVLVALVATPFLVGAAQGLGHDAAHCAKRAEQHPGKEINKCASLPGDPPPPPVQPPPVQPPPVQPPPVQPPPVQPPPVQPPPVQPPPVQPPPVQPPPTQPPPTSRATLSIPPGQLPDAGECRLWIPGDPPGRQPRPKSRPCDGMVAAAPAGGWVLYVPANDPKVVYVRIIDERRAGVVGRVQVFDIQSKQLVREENP